MQYFPNPAIAARKNGRFSIFFQERTLQKVLTAHRVPIYQIKDNEMLIQMQKKSIRFDKNVFLGGTLNLDISSKCLGKFKEFGEILGKYRMFDVKSVGSKWLSLIFQ